MKYRVVLLIFLSIVLSGCNIFNKEYVKGAGVLCKDCNFVLISLTNLRYDALSYNGNRAGVTPNIDALMNRGVVFDRMYTQASWTLPVSMTMYTGLYPYQHKVMNRYNGSSLSKETETIIDILNASGYKTASVNGWYDYNAKFGLTTRFQENDWCRLSDNKQSVSNYGRSDCIKPKALEWLKKNKDSRFFLHVQSFDAHCPFYQGEHFYAASYSGKIKFDSCLWTFGKVKPSVDSKTGEKRYEVRTSANASQSGILLGNEEIEFLRNTYDESVHIADNLVGEIVKTLTDLGLDKKTVIMFVSEHGDLIGEHDRFMRGGPLSGSFYEEVLHVPAVIVIPGVQNNKRVESLTQLTDVGPTVLDVLGLPALKNKVPGVSLVPLFGGSNLKLRDYVFAGSVYEPSVGNWYVSNNSQVEAINNEDWRLVVTREFDNNWKKLSEGSELYRITKKGDEEATDAATITFLRSKLDEWHKEYGEDLER